MPLSRIIEILKKPWMMALGLTTAVAMILYLRYPARVNAPGTTIPSDFVEMLRSWQVFNSGINPYSAVSGLSFKYSPSILGIMGILPQNLSDAWFLFSLLNIIFFAAICMLGARYRTRRDVLYLLCGLFLSWKGIVECLDHGQLEILVFAFFIFATTLFSRFTLLSGAIVGLLPWIKLPLAFLFVPFILAASRRNPEAHGKPPLKRLKLFVSGLVLSTVFWGAALPSLIFGSDRALFLSQSWFSVLKAQPSFLFDNGLNQSLWVSLGRWIGTYSHTHSLVSVGLASISGGLLLGLLVLRRPYAPASQDSFAWGTPWLILGQLVNPLSWRWGSVYLVGTGFSALRTGRRWVWLRSFIWLAVLILFLLQQNPVVKQLGFQNWTDLHEWGTVTAYWILILVLTV